MSRAWKYSSIQSGLRVQPDRRDLQVQRVLLVLKDPWGRLGHKVRPDHLARQARPVRREKLVRPVPLGLTARPVQKDSIGKPLGAVRRHMSSTTPYHFLAPHTSPCKRT